MTVSLLGRNGLGALGDSKRVVILTDLDREGALLASKFVKRLRHEGIDASLSERRRLKSASRGVFLHIENLGRFAGPEGARWGYAGEPGAASRPSKPYPEGLRRYRRPFRGG